MGKACEQLDAELERKQMAKTKRLLAFKSECGKRSEKKLYNEQMEEVRMENIRKRSNQTHTKEVAHMDILAQEMEEELEYKMECIEQGLPTKVTKIDLVKSLVPVPTVSELFCAVKSELDEIKYLKTADLE